MRFIFSNDFPLILYLVIDLWVFFIFTDYFVHLDFFNKFFITFFQNHMIFLKKHTFIINNHDK